MGNEMHRSTYLSLMACLFLLGSLAGCGDDYRLRAKLDDNTEVKAGSPLLLSGTKVGEVRRVQTRDDDKVALVFVSEGARDRIRLGAKFYEHPPGKLQVDLSNVNSKAEQLAPEATVEAPRRNKIELLLVQYAGWQTFVFAALVALFKLLFFFVFRTFPQRMLTGAAVVIAGVFAWFVHEPLSQPLEQRVYPQISETFQKALSHAPTMGEDSSQSNLKSANLTRNVSLPHPKWSAFLGAWFVGFVILRFAIHRFAKAITKRFNKPATPV